MGNSASNLSIRPWVVCVVQTELLLSRTPRCPRVSAQWCPVPLRSPHAAPCLEQAGVSLELVIRLRNEFCHLPRERLGGRAGCGLDTGLTWRLCCAPCLTVGQVHRLRNQVRAVACGSQGSPRSCPALASLLPGRCWLGVAFPRQPCSPHAAAAPAPGRTPRGLLLASKGRSPACLALVLTVCLWSLVVSHVTPGNLSQICMQLLKFASKIHSVTSQMKRSTSYVLEKDRELLPSLAAEQ